jgi:hypothetical protein
VASAAERDRPGVLGAVSGAIAILLFAAGAIAIGDLPDFDASGAEIADHVGDNRAAIQVGVALDAVAVPFLICFLVGVGRLAAAGGPAARSSAAIALGCGIAYVAVFAVDVAALGTSALHPEGLREAPELARALRDFEWIAIGIATPLGVAMLAALAALPLRHGAVWPRWLGWLGAAAASAYALRIGTVFTDAGAFAADGVLGLTVPVAAFTAWILIASVVLALGARHD